MTRLRCIVRWASIALLATVLLNAGQAVAQEAGRAAKLVLSDSLTVTVFIGSADSSIVAYTPEGGFRLRADSTALMNWAKATLALSPPQSASGKGPDDRSVFSATVLRSTDGSGNAMRLLRLSADSAPTYQLAGTNGAWEFRERVAPDKGLLLLAALMGASAPGVHWTPLTKEVATNAADFHPVEAAPGNPRPKYPAKAELAEASGVVAAQFTVGTDGRARMESLLIIRASHPLFALAVRDVLPEMRFLPATHRGIPVEMAVSQNFEFRAR